MKDENIFRSKRLSPLIKKLQQLQKKPGKVQAGGAPTYDHVIPLHLLCHQELITHSPTAGYNKNLQLTIVAEMA